MKTFLKLIILTPVAILLLAFAFANRHSVIVSFDPFAANAATGVAAQAPLFLVLFLTAMVGVIAGGTATWLTQGKHRKAARQSRAEAARLRSKAEAPHVPPGDERLGSSASLQHRA